MAENNKSKQIFVIFLIFLLIVSLLLNYQYYKRHQEAKGQFSSFLHDFYYEVEDIIAILDTLIQEEPTGERLNNELTRLTKHLDILNHMAERVPYYMYGSRGGIRNDLGIVSGIINYGFNYRFGTNYPEHYIPPFRSGNILNQKELAFIKAFKAYMEELKSDLQLEETGELNRDFNKRIFTDIMTEHTSDDIYFSHYRIFLNKYLDIDYQISD